MSESMWKGLQHYRRKLGDVGTIMCREATGEKWYLGITGGLVLVRSNISGGALLNDVDPIPSELQIHGHEQEIGASQIAAVILIGFRIANSCPLSCRFGKRFALLAGVEERLPLERSPTLNIVKYCDEIRRRDAGASACFLELYLLA
jgi:hypothetical protein